MVWMRCCGRSSISLRHPERHRYGCKRPATDKNIAVNYSIKDVEEGKAVCKKALQERFGLHQDGSPVFGMVSRMVGMKGFDLVQSVADGLVDRHPAGDTWAAARSSTSPSSRICAAVIRAVWAPTLALSRRCLSRSMPVQMRSSCLPRARALRPGTDGGLPLRHPAHRPGRPAVAGLHPRLHHGPGQRLHLCWIFGP